eukprot:TRINITY_DN248_c0_g1_i2.p1 TRINITY_DN248_c0_g1~~TRINITY_DN248_c0_g1_i2.p1  ORF type:complete len:317 (+),score=93.84 TRINITY_DN248_c0_g1_i2:716-1666(+)
MAFGKDLNSLNSEKPVPFAEAFDFAQDQMNYRSFATHWYVTEYFTANGRKMRWARKVIDDFAYSIMDERKGHQQEEKDLLSIYLNMKDEEGNNIPRSQVRDAVLNLVIAGRDTTAQVLAWAFFYLISRPEICGKAREEIQSKLGEDQVEYSNYKSLVYINAIFHEALRLHPSVPQNAKQALKDDQIPDGPKIKAWEWVRWSDWQMARDPEIWGEDCAEFKPSRWIDNDGKIIRLDQWKFHAFNGGPRLCLGQTLATFEAISAIASLVKNFHFEFEENWMENMERPQGLGWEENTPMYGSSLTLPMKNPMMVRATKL